MINRIAIIAIFVFCIGLPSSKGQSPEDSARYLAPFQETPFMDDFLLLTKEMNDSFQQGPFLFSHIWESSLGIDANTEPAYFQFDDALYKAGPNASLERLQLLNAASQIDFRPIRTGPINYEAYYLGMNLKDTRLLGLKALEFGFIERLSLNPTEQ